jgi:anti-sigma factor RsiW
MSGLSDQEREDLVAFLDGELDEETARALEARITLDPQARTEAEALRQAWELLDYLPRPEPSASFTHRTLERLAIQTLAHTVPVRRPRWRRWAAGLGWAAAVLVAAAAGFYLAGRLFPPAAPAPVQEPAEVEEQLVRHLRIIQNQRLYRLAEDLEFLQALDQPDLFGEEQGS